MKSIDIKDLSGLPGRRLAPKDTFSFRCHPGIGCFNRCCRNLNLFLYPYDVVRLKNKLGLSSDAFIEQYVDVVMREGNYFPDVLLKMAENADKTCPFLTESGCSVYSDRPDACRTFPLELGVLYESGRLKGETVCFFKPPAFCLGPTELTLWTPQTWEKDQQAEVYHRMTLRWAELKRLFLQNPWGPSGMENPKAKMAFMATYNVDQFREFVFGSSFMKRYHVASTVLRKIKKIDSELMKFGFSWVGFFVWGKPTPDIKAKIK
ncbi:MAG: YkgJ family cysteine cluster protein [Pseudomonadota bacterium]